MPTSLASKINAAMNNGKNIFYKELTPGASTRVLFWRKIVYILGAIILVPIILASIFGDSIMLLFYPVLMFATPLLLISILWLIVVGISNKFDNTESKTFLGKDWKKTVRNAFIIVLVVGVIMFLLLHKYYL